MSEERTAEHPEEAAHAAPPDPMQQILSGLTALYGSNPAATDAITQLLVMILGSGPALAAYQGLLQAQNAGGLMYHNAIANQQKTNLLGMAMTAKCVRYMLEPNAPPLDVEAMLHDEQH